VRTLLLSQPKVGFDSNAVTVTHRMKQEYARICCRRQHRGQVYRYQYTQPSAQDLGTCQFSHVMWKLQAWCFQERLRKLKNRLRRMLPWLPGQLSSNVSLLSCFALVLAVVMALFVPQVPCALCQTLT
jgi:hypothetical protein